MTVPQLPLSDPPARKLRLLANLGPAATVVFGLVTIWLAVTTLQNLGRPMTSTVVVSLVAGVFAALAAGSVTYRLGIEVPRTLRGWHVALAERHVAVAERMQVRSND